MGGPSETRDEDAVATETDDTAVDSDPPGGVDSDQTAADEEPEGTADDPPDQETETSWSSIDRFEVLTLFRVVLAVTAVALVLRLVALGARSAHWDEARVAYWASFYADTGALGYHWEEHGPLVQVVAGRLFELFGASDFTARLPVAVVGGLLPLSAYLYRKHLRRSEVVALALFLTLNPVLLYYSRFMRSDVLVAAFLFTGFGLLVRYYDTRRLWYVVGAGVAVGLGFASKENASIYVLTWLGASVLLVDQFLHSPATSESGVDRVRSRFRDTYLACVRFLGGLDRPGETLATYREGGRLGTALERLVSAVLVVVWFLLAWLTTVVFLFATRGGGVARRGDPFAEFRPVQDPVTLDATLRDPTLLPALVDDTLRWTYHGYKEWFTASGETTLDEFLDVLLGGYVEFLVSYAPVLVGFAIVGFVLERYVRRHPRTLVMFMAYCGLASLVGYPIGSDIGSDYAWISTHILVPLAVPASVALAAVYRTAVTELSRVSFGRPALEAIGQRGPGRDQLGSLAVVALVLVAAVTVSWLWLSPLGLVFVDDQATDNGLVQFAQPHSDLSPVVTTMDDIAGDHEGNDVVFYYGQQAPHYDERASLVHDDISPDALGGWEIRPRCSQWGNAQPLNWYLAATGADATCKRSPDALAAAIEDDPPPMIVGSAADSTLGLGENATAAVPALEREYEREHYYLRTVGQEVVVYVHESRT